MTRSRLSLALQNNLVLIVLAMVLVVPMFIGSIAGARGAKAGAFELLGVALLITWLIRVDERAGWRRALEQLRSGPNLPIALLLIWAGLLVFISPSRAYSVESWLRLGGGALVYVVLVYHLRHRAQVRTLLTAVCVVAILAVLAGFALDRQTGLTDLGGLFRDRQLFGGFLALLLPVLLGVAVGASDRRWRLLAQVSALLVGACLLLTRCRSAWLGAAVGIAVFLALGFAVAWGVRRLVQRKHEWLLAPAAALVALGLALVPQFGGPLAHRAGTLLSLGRDASVVDRLALAQSALAMIQARPLTGFGPGMYAFYQPDFLPQSREASIIQGMGPTLSENAHNFYLQTGAELGVVGLALYLAILIAFFVTGMRALRRLNPGLRKYVLIGCLAAIAGQSVDALANPAWQFTECAMFFWLVLGLGMAAAGLGATAEEPAREAQPAARWVTGVPPFLYRGARTAAIGCLALWLGAQVFNVTLVQAAVAEPEYCPFTEAIEFDYLADGVAPPGAFAIDQASIEVGQEALFKVYARTASLHEFADVSCERHVNVRSDGSGRTQKRSLSSGDCVFVYVPSRKDAGNVVTLTARMKCKKTKAESVFETQFLLLVLPSESMGVRGDDDDDDDLALIAGGAAALGLIVYVSTTSGGGGGSEQGDAGSRVRVVSEDEALRFRFLTVQGRSVMDVSSDRTLRVRHTGAGRLDRVVHPDGKVDYVYHPAKEDVGKPVRITAEVRAGNRVLSQSHTLMVRPAAAS